MAKTKKSWNKNDIKVIIDSWGDKSAKEIASKLGRKAGDVYVQVNKLRSVGFRMPKKKRPNKTVRMLAELGIHV